MKISKSKRLERLADHLAYCHAAAEKGRYDALAHCLLTELAPVLSLVSDDFDQLEDEFQGIKAQVEQAGADVDEFFALLDKGHPQTA